VQDATPQDGQAAQPQDGATMLRQAEEARQYAVDQPAKFHETAQPSH
jgi:hypothetical protein